MRLTGLLTVFALCLCCAPLPAQHQSSSGKMLLPRERVPNLGKVKDLLRSYHDCTCKCGCYASELKEQSDRAIAFLERRARARMPNERLAVVLDIDDTALSNYSHYETTDLGRIWRLFDPWVESAQAPAVEETLRLFQRAQQLQVAVFFISGRRENLKEATEKNLQAQGYTGWSGLLLRPTEDTSQSVIGFKSLARERVLNQGYRIVLNVGDQLSDLTGEPSAELSVKLPNPFYFTR